MVSLRPDAAEADDLMSRSLARWRRSGEPAGLLGLTRFALLDLHQRGDGAASLSADGQRFMLKEALAYGHEDAFWWQQVDDPHHKVQLSTAILRQEGAAAIPRLVGRLIDDPGLPDLDEKALADIGAALFGLAWNTIDARLRAESLRALLHLVRPAAEWRPVAMSAERDADLAGLALEDPPQGDRAAQLIGRLRSLTAVRKLVEIAPPQRRSEALQRVWETAGGLPAAVPAGLRLGIALNWAAGRLKARPLRTLSAVGAAAVGGTLGFGAVTFLSYRLPDYFDTTRLRISLEHGWFLGLSCGLGLILTRLMAGRLNRLKALPRGVLAAAVGGLTLSIAFSAYHTGILNTPPAGGLILAGSLLMASGFAAAEFGRGPLLRIVVALAGSFAAIAGTWGLHAALAAVPTDLTPLLRFEYGLPLGQVLGLAALAALPLAGLAALVDLDPGEE
jgi:hypothetical protein